MEKRHRLTPKSTGEFFRPPPLASEVMARLQEFRFLTTAHLHAHLGGNKLYLQQVLTKLFHESNTPHKGPYLARPEQCLKFANFYYRPATYENGERAWRHLREIGRYDALAHRLARGGRNSVHREFPHEAMACECLSSIELGAKAAGVGFVPQHRVLDHAPESRRRSNWPLSFELQGARLTPDRMFGLRYGDCRYRFFALEANRTMAPARFKEKIEHYRAVVANRLYRAQLGVPNLVVLTITTSEATTESLLALCEAAGSPTYFAFATVPGYADYFRTPPPLPELFTEPWRRAGHPDFILGETR